MRIFAKISTENFHDTKIILVPKNIFLHRTIIYIENILKYSAHSESSVKHSTVLAFPSFPRYTHAQPLMREIDQDEVSHASGGAFLVNLFLRFAFLITSKGAGRVGVART